MNFFTFYDRMLPLPCVTAYFCPGGGTGIHTWLRAMAPRACGFEPRPGHHADIVKW